MQTINDAGLKLIESFEGCKLTSYRDQRGVWTVGYGSTHGVFEGLRITQADAEVRLRADLATAEAAVGRLVRVKLSDNQFSALVALVFNIGSGAFSGSRLRSLINTGAMQLAATVEWPKWNRVNSQANEGLSRRRAAEARLFMTPDECA